MAEAEEAEASREPLGTLRLRPEQCHELLKDRLAAEFEEIMAGFVSQAKAGSCAHMKFALELLRETDEDEQEGGSAWQILQELGD